MSNSVLTVYEQLFEAYGPQNWWPGDSPFEVMVGAILVQNTAWRNVERAIANLKDEGLLSVTAIHDLDVPELEELIRPAGYYRLKARRLRNLVSYLSDVHGGSVDVMFQQDLPSLRQELLSVNGVGPETADSILLYAGDLPTFVVDTYTQRVLRRHGWIEPEADYAAVKEHFEAALPTDAQLFNEYHALLVRVGHLHCRRTPKCAGCPLEEYLPEGGIVEPED